MVPCCHLFVELLCTRVDRNGVVRCFGRRIWICVQRTAMTVSWGELATNWRCNANNRATGRIGWKLEPTTTCLRMLYDSLGAVASQLELADWVGTSSHGRGWSDGWPPTPAAKRKVSNPFWRRCRGCGARGHNPFRRWHVLQINTTQSRLNTEKTQI
jgi:hypothetical protein